MNIKLNKFLYVLCEILGTACVIVPLFIERHIWSNFSTSFGLTLLFAGLVFFEIPTRNAEFYSTKTLRFYKICVIASAVALIPLAILELGDCDMPAILFAVRGVSVACAIVYIYAMLTKK